MCKNTGRKVLNGYSTVVGHRTYRVGVTVLPSSRIGVCPGVVTPSLLNAPDSPVYKESQQTTFTQQLRVQKALCSFAL